MPTEIQIVNRSPVLTKKIVAKLHNTETGDSILEFIVGPGEAVNVPIGIGMAVLVKEEEYRQAVPPDL